MGSQHAVILGAHGYPFPSIMIAYRLPGASIALEEYPHFYHMQRPT